MRFAVLGLGSAGSRHASLLHELGHDVVGFDADEGRAGPSGVARASAVADAIAATEAVVVASPSALHAEQALAAIAAQRHVLVEKPLSTSLADARAVADAAAAAGVVCGVAMNLRFHPGVVRVRELLAAGALGEPLIAQASMGFALPLWRPGTDYRASYSARADLGGGILWDAIHELDYLAWLLGPVHEVSGALGRVSDLELDVEDTAMAILRFASGAMATLDLNFVEAAYRRGCVVAGSRATARWDWTAGTVTVRREGEADRVEDVASDVADTYRAELEDFAAAIGGGRPPRAPVDDGVEAVRVAEAIRRSAFEGRVVGLTDR